jgi:hypothetical protein
MILVCDPRPHVLLQLDHCDTTQLTVPKKLESICVTLILINLKYDQKFNPSTTVEIC